MGKSQLLILVLLLGVAAGSFYAGGIYRFGEGSAGTVWIVVRNEVENTVLVSENVEISKGETVFEVLDEVADVEYTEYPLAGKFITSIDGVGQTTTVWWLYYVNGQLGGVAADRYMVMDGDNILWEYTSEMPFS